MWPLHILSLHIYTKSKGRVHSNSKKINKSYLGHIKHDKNYSDKVMQKFVKYQSKLKYNCSQPTKARVDQSQHRTVQIVFQFPNH